MRLIRRSLAALLDLVIVGGASYLVWHLQPIAHPDATGNYGGPGCVLLLLNVAGYLLYFAVSESTFGFSPGKGMFNLRVVTDTGRKPSFNQGLKRHALDIIDFQFFGLAALIAAKVTGGRRLGDLWAGTRVTEDRGESSR